MSISETAGGNVESGNWVSWRKREKNEESATQHIQSRYCSQMYELPNYPWFQTQMKTWIISKKCIPFCVFPPLMAYCIERMPLALLSTSQVILSSREFSVPLHSYLHCRFTGGAETQGKEERQLGPGPRDKLADNLSSFSPTVGGVVGLVVAIVVVGGGLGVVTVVGGGLVVATVVGDDGGAIEQKHTKVMQYVYHRHLGKCSDVDDDTFPLYGSISLTGCRLWGVDL